MDSKQETDSQRRVGPGKAKRYGHLYLEEETMLKDFDREPFMITHGLCGHPLLQLPALVELATRLPEDLVEYNSGKLKVGQEPELTPRTGLSIEDTLRQIETENSWMVMKFVEKDPTYSRLLDECLDAIKPLVDRVRPGMRRRHGFIFVSSPGAVTPFHVDFEHNFLLHVRGTKSMTVWDGEDRSVMSEASREGRLTGVHRNLYWEDGFSAKGRTFELTPGDGLHVPLSSPHWVKVGGEVSISFSITFMTDHGARTCTLHRINAFLRERGLNPRDVGTSPFVDSVKIKTFRALTRLGRTRIGARPAWKQMKIPQVPDFLLK